MGIFNFSAQNPNDKGKYTAEDASAELRKEEAGAKKSSGYNVFFLPDKGRMRSIRLPAVPEGRVVVPIRTPNGRKHQILIEAQNGQWTVQCSKPLCFLRQSEDACQKVFLRGLTMISIGNLGISYCIYAEEINDESSCFHNYIITKAQEIRIGNSADNDIVCKNPFVSRHHATLHLSNNLWSVVDEHSTNGIYVNGKWTENSLLMAGDTIFIMGIRIIMGVNFISVNDGLFPLEFNCEKLHRIETTNELSLPKPEMDKTGEKLFNRLPRRREAMFPAQIEIEAPPMSTNSTSVPLALRMGSSAVMGGNAALSGNYMMLLSSVLFPVLTQKFTDHEKKEYEALRYEKYTKYLEDKRQEIAEEKRKEEDVLRRNYPSLSTLLTYPQEKENLWERRKTDDDFLWIRLGKGKLPLAAELTHPKRGFTMDEDELEEEMFRIAEKKVLLDDVPIMADIVKNFVCGISGPRDQSYAFARRMVYQLSVLHSYDELKMVFLIDPKMMRHLDFIRYLPHAWSDQRDMRFIASDVGDAIQLGEYLKHEIVSEEKHQKTDLTQILKKRPYYVFFAFSKKMYDSIEFLKEIVQNDTNIGASVITVFDDIPKECSLLFNVTPSGKQTVTYLRDMERNDETFIVDSYDHGHAAEGMKILANTVLKNISGSYSLPKTLTFLEMFGVGRVEHLDPLKRWRESDPIHTLSTPIGISEDGTPFTLDLHQKFQGPHGLVAGTTGSGKSEFLITYILSLAINYSPDEVAFLLIDYKGGGLTDAFDNPDKGLHLPHLVGAITNLDGDAISRSLVSINSELKRRQQVFHDKKSVSDEGTMDIYQYQKLYRAGKVDEPMPHLFIIADEFAELKQQQPEFMDDLISAARIGRSLGVHLILATQKPTGVVNDQIKSNSKFKICLKVQNKSDSEEMLNRPEAAELKTTGRFYLQVGYNEFFALGQSAWTGASYEPQDEVVVRPDDSIQILDTVGQTRLSVRPKEERQEAVGSQLVAVVKLLSQIAEKENMLPRTLWKPAMPEKLPIDSPLIIPPRPMSMYEVSLGLLDDPERQEQYPLTINLATCSNLWFVGSGSSGKTTLVHSIIYTLLHKCTPDQFQFYALDYSSRTFKHYKLLPHCGGVLYEEDVDELDNFFKVITEITKERKKLCSQVDASFENLIAEHPLPLILVVIDNVTALNSSKKSQNYFYGLQNYIKDSVRYGIKFILTCGRNNDLGTQVRHFAETRVAFHLKDKYECADFLGCKVIDAPPEKPGRGVFAVGGRSLQFQACMYRPELSEKEHIEALKDDIQRLTEMYIGAEGARRLPVISETATYADFCAQFKKGRFPIGFSKIDKRAVALPLKQFSSLGLYFGNQNGEVPIFENALFAARREKMQLWVVRRPEHSVFSEESAHHVDMRLLENTKIFDCVKADIDRLWKELTEILTKRSQMLQAYCADNKFDIAAEDVAVRTFDYMYEQTEPLMIVVENMAELSASVDLMAGIMLDKLFQTSAKCNAYIIAGYEPEDDKVAAGGMLYSAFNGGETALLMGGRLDKQKLCAFPPEADVIKKVIPYNIGLMRYRDSFYPILMPCGEIAEEELNEDDISIF